MLSKKPSEQSEETRQASSEAGAEETQRLNAEIPKSLHQRIQIQKAKDGRSIKEIVVDALEEHLET